MAQGRKTGGRTKGTPNKATASIKELAGKHSEEAVKTLLSVMQNTAEPAAARVSAAKEILDRAHGKATQPVSGDDAADPIRTVTEIILSAPGYDDSSD